MAAEKKTKRETREQQGHRVLRERAQQRMAEVVQARQEAAQRPEGYRSDPERYGWALVIPVDSKDAGDVACYAIARMAQRLAGVCKPTWPSQLDQRPTHRGSYEGYYVECHFEVEPDNQPTDEELHTLVLGTLRDLGLEAMGITGAELVRFEYEDWEWEQLTAEEKARIEAAEDAERQAKRTRLIAEMDQRVVERKAAEEKYQAEWPHVVRLIEGKLMARYGQAAGGPDMFTIYQWRNNGLLVRVYGAETYKEIRKVVEQVPGLQVKWRGYDKDANARMVMGEIIAYPSIEPWAHLKAKFIQGQIGGATDGAVTG